jgi:hypothetical protein
MTTQEIQRIGDEHYRQLVATIKTGDAEKISFHLACLNYMRAKQPYAQWAGQQGVMHGWLTLDDACNFVLHPSLSA